MSQHDIYRAVYHFTPSVNFINDPNGLVFFRGEYHLFYQYNPFGDRSAHKCWGHAVSSDLARWEHLPVALWEDEAGQIFSGSAVVDWANTSGFGGPDAPALVAIYTAHTPTEETQHIAFSTDAGRAWTKYAGNPVIAIGSRNFRDPKVLWHEPTRRWIMVTVLADLHRVRFYGSPDLRHWTHLNDFGPAGSADGVWECPDLFPLAVEGAEGEARWVLKVDVGSHNLPTNEGAQYFVGRFDGVCFTNDNPPELALWADAGRDFYAVQSWSDIPAADGRRLWLAWLSNWHYANITPTAPWRGMMTIPRVVTLRRTPVGLRLAQRPVAELEALRRTHFGRAGLPVSEANRQLQAAGLAGDALEIIADFRLDTATEIGLRVRVGSAEATVIGYDVAAQHLCVDRSQSGNVGFSSGFPGRRTAALPQAEGRVRLHVFVDRCSVEVFGGAGEAVLTDLIFPSPDSQGLEVYSAAGEAGADALLERLDIWRLEQT